MAGAVFRLASTVADVIKNPWDSMDFNDTRWNNGI
jgi:hypothetical protein